MSGEDKTARAVAYAARVEAKRERFAERAASARAGAASARAQEERIGSAIPMGQPILVGHHSEKRHRRDVARIDALVRRQVELGEKAAHYERRAERYGTRGISSDNPEAIDLLRAKVAELEATRDLEKEINAEIARQVKARAKAGTLPPEGWGRVPAHLEIIAALDIPETLRRGLESQARAYPWAPKFGAGTTAEIRRCEQRIRDLEATSTAREDVRGEGWVISENTIDNRIEIHFDARQPDAIVEVLRREGWRWTPSKTAWTRQLTPNARTSAERVRKALEGQR